MGMSGMYGRSDDTESIATIHAALDAGVTLVDTGDYYGAGHNELLIGRALRDRRDRALVSVKFGAMRAPEGRWIGIDTRPAAVRNFLAYSLTRLGLDHVDIYRPGRLDPQVPIEETIGAIADLVKAGYVRAIGLSEVGPETIRRAAAVHPICDLQIEYSLVSRDLEAKILPVVRSLGIGLTIYGVPVARPAQQLPAGRVRRFSRPSPAVHRGKPRAERSARRSAAGGGRRERGDGLATGDRLGVVEGRRHGAAHRRPNAVATARVAGRTRAAPVTRRTRAARSARAGHGRGGHAL
jgi:aryl-alcohol dehydrogenase-like predicted oxidoreductase